MVVFHVVTYHFLGQYKSTNSPASFSMAMTKTVAGIKKLKIWGDDKSKKGRNASGEIKITYSAHVAPTPLTTE